MFESPDASKWPVLQGLDSQVGDWIDDVLSAPKVAETITTAMPIEGGAVAQGGTNRR